MCLLIVKRTQSVNELIQKCVIKVQESYVSIGHNVLYFY